MSSAAEQLAALQGVIESQAQDRSTSIAVIEQLQDEVAQAHDRQQDLEKRCAFLESKCEIAEGAAANPGPAFVSVEELVAERGRAADARTESDRLRVKCEELQAELTVARSRIKTLVSV
jgi:BMFP domain-containing protein YqiC